MPPRWEINKQGKHCWHPSSSIFANLIVFSFPFLQTNAKQQYQLTDKDLAKLGNIRRPNKSGKNRAPLCLYLESQVRDTAYAKHGGAEGIEARARALLDAKMQIKLKRREEEQEEKAREVERLKRIRKEIEEGEAASNGKTCEVDPEDAEEI